jgi:thymidylate synthase ThyX
MRLIKPSYEILTASTNSELPYNYSNSDKLIEIAGRTCYKSEDKITEESSEKFIQMLTEKEHFAILEHSWELRYYPTITLPIYMFLNYLQVAFVGTLVAGNRRAFDEWDYNKKLKFMQPTETDIRLIYKEHRWDMLSATVRFVCDRGISHEVVRHRPPSYAQESTRWCNYSQKRFGQHISFIIPIWLSDQLKEGTYELYTIHQEDFSEEAYEWLTSICYAESKYFKLVNEYHWIPGRARSVLPNALKTEIVVTADLAEWLHIFKLRRSETAHEQMRELMIPLYNEFKILFPTIFE